jgi:hypothetical protein
MCINILQNIKAVAPKQKQKGRMQMFPLSVEVCKELDNAVKHNHPNVEVNEGGDLFVYKLDDFTYYVNGNDVPSGIFYVEGKWSHS